MRAVLSILAFTLLLVPAGWAADEDAPDPWIDADALLARGEHEAAAALARGSSGKATEKLAAYVVTRRDAPPETEARAAWKVVEAAVGNKTWSAVLRAAGSFSLDTVTAIRLAEARGMALQELNRLEESAQVLREAAAAARELGWRKRAAVVYAAAGGSAWYRGDLDGAQTAWEAWLELADSLGDKIAAARAFGNLGLLHADRGNLVTALAYHTKTLDAMRALGDRRREAIAMLNIGATHQMLGDFPKALGLLQRARELAESIEEPLPAATAVTGIALAYQSMGDYAEALRLHEESLALYRALGDERGVAAAYGNLGNVHDKLGDHESALRYGHRSLEIMETIGDRSGMASVLGNLGTALKSLGRHDDALEHLRRSLKLEKALGHAVGVAITLGNIGQVLWIQGDPVEARRHFERALAVYEEKGDREGVLSVTLALGKLTAEEGSPKAAARYLERGVREARRLRSTPLLVSGLRALAWLRFRQGDPGRALLRAQQALSELEDLLGGLGEEEAASAKESHGNLFSVGLLAAAALDEPAEALTFLESGRAGALLESLGGRQVLRWAELPEALVEEEEEARAAEGRARHEYERALESGNLAAIRKQLAALDEARGCTKRASARIQREAKREAGLFYPRAATLEEVQSRLDEETALVLYGLCREKVLALVVLRDDARIVDLGGLFDLYRISTAFDPGANLGTTTEALANQRRRLVVPLALPASVKRVLVSPEGPLSYVPFGALFDECTVTFTPSGTTHVLLTDERHEAGTKVLALGDPVYGGPRLPSLPATRAEAEAVGDVVLVGEQATEKALRETLPQQARWRAIHLACHGLVDPERPTLSALALTPDGEDDGMLRCLEVLRMRMPADLAVLSACDTGRGRVVRGEGIVGLTRAFMYAGAPRVLCSLWKVDDAATLALMKRFYELWHADKGLGAAAALKEAQAFVRSQETWEHPRYWAAWVLWGLPD